MFFISSKFQNLLKNIFLRYSEAGKFFKGMELEDSFKNLIYIDKIPYTVVTEGKAEVLFPSSHDVFYNPVQEFNRDLSIAILKQFSKEYVRNGIIKNKINKKMFAVENSSENEGLKILEALAASGLRSIRFAKEITSLKNIIANDRDSKAYESMLRNISHNNVEDIVKATNEDASLLMYKNRLCKDRFDVIDLDPYGTASSFLDAAVQSVSDGGLLMVTCTDMAVLCGNGTEACHAKYGAVSTKLGCCHEMALRIVLQCIESHANRYGRYIEPVLSLSVDFYVRVFVRVFTSLNAVKQSVCKLSMVYVCNGCGSYHLQPLGNRAKTDKGEKFSAGSGPPVDKKCIICESNHKVCGPIWSDKLHNKEFIQKTIKSVAENGDQYQTSKRIIGMLSVVMEELDDCPLYHRIEHLTRIVHVPSPTNVVMRSAILNAGYQVSMSHASPTSIKTNAPQNIIWDIVRAWAKLNPGKKTLELVPSKIIIGKESSLDVSFELHADADPQSRIDKMLRFQVNPTANWGPKCRATTSLFKSKEEEKRKMKQNKRQKVLDELESSKKIKNDDTELKHIEVS